MRSLCITEMLFSILFCFRFTISSVSVFKRDSLSEREIHKMIVDQYFEKRKSWKTSNLGTILYKNVDANVFNRRNKYFSVLLWHFSEDMKKRFNFLEHDKEILDGCSVDNCGFYDNPYAVEIVDVIVVHVNRGPLPLFDKTKSIKKWILFNDEPPKKRAGNPAFYPLGKWMSSHKVFNWTMSYRSDADIPVPYGRTVPLEKPVDVDLSDSEVALSQLVPNWDEKQMIVVAATVFSRCKEGNRRENLLEDLSKYIKVDFQEVNPKTDCIDKDCKSFKEYLFFIVLENVSCRQYLSEKIFRYAYSAGAIPVISGPPLEDCDKLLPPNSFLHVDFYKSTKDLARSLLQISADLSRILVYHMWRRHFAVTNEHGYFKTKAMHYCRICEALNYNDGDISSYDSDELRLFFDEKFACDMEFNYPR